MYSSELAINTITGKQTIPYSLVIVNRKNFPNEMITVFENLEVNLH